MYNSYFDAANNKIPLNLTSRFHLIKEQLLTPTALCDKQQDIQLSRYLCDYCCIC
jgi:hypothetical protein